MLFPKTLQFDFISSRDKKKFFTVLFETALLDTNSIFHQVPTCIKQIDFIIQRSKAIFLIIINWHFSSEIQMFH
jgi:hypothetical protein